VNAPLEQLAGRQHRDDLRRADTHARDLAVTRFDAPLALEAGAGTGKTTTLVARIVAWCVGLGWERAAAQFPLEEPARLARRVASGVFAITFTEAAAAEMATRAAQALGTLAAGEKALGMPIEDTTSRPSRAERAAHLLAAVDLFEISTIHAFCMRVLRDQALSLGLHPAFQIDADGEATQAIARRVVARGWPAALEAGASGALELARRAVSGEHLVDAVVDLSKLGVDGALLTRDPALVVGPVLANFRAACEALLATIAGLPFGKALKNPEKLRVALTEWLAAKPEPEPLGELERARAAFEPHAEQVRKWSEDDIQVGVAKVGDAAAIGAAAGVWTTAWEVFAAFDAVAFGAAAAVLAPLLDEAQTLRQREGWLGYDDLLAEAARWARAGGSGLEHWRARIRQLLVDEFQDTDVRQCDLVAALALDGPRESRPGLFVVGDPKQSIYGWRAADLAAYESLIERLVREGGEKHTLSINFRSSQEVLDEVERALTPLLVHEPGVQARFEPLVVPADFAGRPPPLGTSAVEYWTTWRRGDGDAPLKVSSPATTALEARALARDLVATRANDPSLLWRDCAVLLRSTTDQELTLRALREAGVPFTVAKERSFWHHREVQDLSLTLRAILDPSEDVALVAFLRSPHVGVPDGAFALVWSALAPLTRALNGDDDDARHVQLAALLGDAAARLASAVPNAAPSPHWPRLANQALVRLGALRAAWRRAPLLRFVHELRHAFAAEAGEAARRLGTFRTSNLDAFHAEFEARARACDADTYELLRWLRARRDEQSDAEPQRPAEDAVLVSTIHGAKGLEFKVVYLANGHKKSGRSGRNDTHGSGARASGADVALKLVGFEGLGWKSAARRAKRVEEAERARLLYVALTRAKARLVIAASAAPDARSPSGAPESFAVALLHRRPDDILERFAAALSGAAASDAAPDADGVHWRFPREVPAPPNTAHDTRTAIDATRARADAAHLERARSAAVRHAARPLALSASSDLPREELHDIERSAERASASSGAADAASTIDVVDDSTSSSDAAPIAASSPTTSSASGSSSRTDDLARRAAKRVGTLVHDLLARRAVGEREPAQFAAARAVLAAASSNDEQRLALERFDTLAAALASGPFLARLDALAGDPSVRGPYAELPILLAAAPTDTAASHLTGAADLVFCDASGWVVVDFKTDHVPTAEGRAARAAHYAPQLERYAVALQRALALPKLPRRELWWLASGSIDVV
jgi:ATP-dependent helicase/nuclease subunit A